MAIFRTQQKEEVKAAVNGFEIHPLAAHAKSVDQMFQIKKQFGCDRICQSLMVKLAKIPQKEPGP
ncbi:hypothetical protein DSCO28_73540 (plasmid) [Desulfosarcina ovata subsp. sediminis]|uniref:Uncharacterized protein n=1 Tax=Desulfosarcina ovata subsp. sediminis TaxID=885957 RepID=A0A5K8A2Z4_9BACT|nr:hypothetical protein [Desulfosarcina ovata]BBO86788.1 hypothetical protein DSCO28_73540 [Desulfosarcina ovata subsp. sediminis]